MNERNLSLRSSLINEQLTKLARFYIDLGALSNQSAHLIGAHSELKKFINRGPFKSPPVGYGGLLVAQREQEAGSRKQEEKFKNTLPTGDSTDKTR